MTKCTKIDQSLDTKLFITKVLQLKNNFLEYSSTFSVYFPRPTIAYLLRWTTEQNVELCRRTSRSFWEQSRTFCRRIQTFSEERNSKELLETEKMLLKPKNSKKCFLFICLKLKSDQLLINVFSNAH